MEDINFLTSSFINSVEKSIQFDFFRDNGEVLMQLYKQYDVNKWDVDFFHNDLESIVLEIRFHKDKTNNKKNRENFIESLLFNSFELVEIDTFFMRIPSDISSTELIELIYKIMDEVYDYHNVVNYTLNAY